MRIRQVPANFRFYLKPHNIMCKEREQLALVNFEFAKPIDPNTTAQMQLTQDGMVLAPPYI